jgi:hypothetical protein
MLNPRRSPFSTQSKEASATRHMYSASLPLIEWVHGDGHIMGYYPDYFTIKLGNMANLLKYHLGVFGSCI